MTTPAVPSPESRPRPVSATQLRSMWRTASRERGWSYPDDWWTPAVDALTEAVVSGGGIAESCLRLGRARARAGVSMAETLSDVLAMAALVRSLDAHPTNRFCDEQSRDVDPVELIRSAAIGWSEEAGFGRAPEPVDTLTALADCSYLSVRLGEVAAESEAGGARLSQNYAFVVASLLGPSHLGEPGGIQEQVEAWDHAWQMSQLADDLRSVYSAGETIVQAGPTIAIVLARRTPELAGQVAALRNLIEGRRFSATPEGAPVVGIWVEGLPDSLRQARLLLDDLRR